MDMQQLEMRSERMVKAVDVLEARLVKLKAYGLLGQIQAQMDTLRRNQFDYMPAIEQILTPLSASCAVAFQRGDDAQAVAYVEALSGFWNESLILDYDHHGLGLFSYIDIWPMMRDEVVAFRKAAKLIFGFVAKAWASYPNSTAALEHLEHLHGMIGTVSDKDIYLDEKCDALREVTGKDFPRQRLVEAMEMLGKFDTKSAESMLAVLGIAMVRNGTRATCGTLAATAPLGDHVESMDLRILRECAEGLRATKEDLASLRRRFLLTEIEKYGLNTSCFDVLAVTRNGMRELRFTARRCKDQYRDIDGHVLFDQMRTLVKEWFKSSDAKSVVEVVLMDPTEGRPDAILYLEKLGPDGWRRF